MRLQALETRIDADLRLGRHASVITELQRLAHAHPLREHVQALLMLALYRDGRQAEALAVYSRAPGPIRAGIGMLPAGSGYAPDNG
jgi:DNA-binding SARP family transcriptional activator